MPLPFIIGGLAALGSAIGGAATLAGTAAAGVATAAGTAAAAAGTAAAGVATAAGTAAAAVGTAAVGTATTAGTAAVAAGTAAVGTATTIGGTVVSLAAAHPVGAVVATGLTVHAIDGTDKDKAVEEAREEGKREGIEKTSDQYELKFRKQEEQISQVKNQMESMRKKFSQEKKGYLQAIDILKNDIAKLKKDNESLENKLAEAKELEGDMLQYIKKLEEEKYKLVSKLASATISEQERGEIEIGIREIRDQIDGAKEQLEEVKLLQAS